MDFPKRKCFTKALGFGKKNDCLKRNISRKKGDFEIHSNNTLVKYWDKKLHCRHTEEHRSTQVGGEAQIIPCLSSLKVHPSPSKAHLHRQKGTRAQGRWGNSSNPVRETALAQLLPVLSQENFSTMGWGTPITMRQWEPLSRPPFALTP